VYPPMRNPIVLIFSLFFGGAVLLVGIGYLAKNARFHAYGVHKVERQKYARLRSEAKLKDAVVSGRVKLEAAPTLRVEKSSYAYGRVTPSSEIQRQIPIMNVGNAPLHIASVECEAFDIRCRIDAAMIQPQESANILITWKFEETPGPLERELIIRCDDVMSRKSKIRISAEVPARFSFSGDRLECTEALPGQPQKVKGFLYSQLYDNFQIEDINIERPGVKLDYRPMNAQQLRDVDAKSGYHITGIAAGMPQGRFEIPANFSLRPDITTDNGNDSDAANGTELMTCTTNISGRVKPRVFFISPDIDRDRGMSFGLMHNDKEHRFALTVKVRGEVPEDLQVLEIQPAVLKSKLTTTRRPGTYRLEIIVPKGIAPIRFNSDAQHGFVTVGVTSDPVTSNWFPIFGNVTRVVKRDFGKRQSRGNNASLAMRRDQ
ncbi:MAG: DUF1573 domain-containing protein, partial [Planctomycetota bacterium]